MPQPDVRSSAEDNGYDQAEGGGVEEEVEQEQELEPEPGSQFWVEAVQDLFREGVGGDQWNVWAHSHVQRVFEQF